MSPGFCYCPANDEICIYCREIINPASTGEHKNCKDFYDFILENMIEETKHKLEFLLNKRFIIK